MMSSKKAAVLSSAVLIGIVSTSISTATFAAESHCDSYNVQTFATTVSRKADAMKANLQRHGFRGAISTSQSSGKALYRVRVGPYEDKVTAMKIQGQLATKNLSTDSNLILKGKAPCSKLIISNSRGEIKFKRGTSSMLLSGGVVQGEEPNTYTLTAGSGQWMEVKVSSLKAGGKNSADFVVSLLQPSTGKEIQLKGLNGRDYWIGQLPSPGYSKGGKGNAATIKVTGIDNASYHMNVAIKSSNWTK